MTDLIAAVRHWWWAVVILVVATVTLSISLVKVLDSIDQRNRQREQIYAVLDKINDCTLPGPKLPTAQDPTTGHDCYDEGVRRTGGAIASIRLSLDCAVLWASDIRTVACQEVQARLDTLAEGEIPDGLGLGGTQP